MNRHERRKQRAIDRCKGVPPKVALNMDESYAASVGIKHGDTITIEGDKCEYIANVVTATRKPVDARDWIGP